MKTWIIKEISASILRHVLTSVAAALVTAGALLPAQSSQFLIFALQAVGGCLWLAGVAMSACHKENAAKQLELLAEQIDADPPAAAAPMQTAMLSTSAAPAASAQRASAAMLAPLIAFAFFAFLCGNSASAQESITNAQPPMTAAPAMPPMSVVIPGLSIGTLTNLGVNTNVISAANDLAKIFAPLIPYFTNHDITIDLDGVYTRGKFGALADLQYPITPNLSLGGGAAYVADQWFFTALSTKLGSQFTIPVLKKKGYAFAETGLALPLKRVNAEDQSVAGAVLPFDINKYLTFIVEAGLGKETSLPGEFYFGGASLNIKW